MSELLPVWAGFPLRDAEPTMDFFIKQQARRPLSPGVGSVSSNGSCLFRGSSWTAERSKVLRGS